MYFIASACTLSLATTFMLIVHGNWWLAVLVCAGFSVAAYLTTMFYYRRRVRRGDVVRFEGGSDSLAVPFAGGFGGVVLGSLALGSFVNTMVCLLLAAASGLMLAGARFSKTSTKTDKPEEP